jgi:hypothetical protein
MDHCRLKHLAMRHTIMGKTMALEDTMDIGFGKDAIARVVGRVHETFGGYVGFIHFPGYAPRPM